MRELKVETFRLEDLHTYHANPRRGDVDAIAESLRKRGQYRPIVVNIGTHASHDFEILAGNHTYMAAKKLGWETIQATTVDVDDEQAAQIVLADNRLADLGGYDDQALADLLSSIDDLEGTGWEQDDVDGLLDALSEEDDDSEVEEVDVPDDAEPRVKRGEVWILGAHRLMCGDSTNKDDVEKLLGGGVADLLITDPPYNVALGMHNRPSEMKQLHRRTDGLVIANDSWPDDESFINFLTSALGQGIEHMKPGAAFYIWYASSQESNFLEGAKRAGMRIRETLIWSKNTFALGRQDYQWRHEPCLYGWKDGAAHSWYSDRKQTTVLEFDKPSRNAEHPTMKPVPLIGYLMGNSSRKNDLVLDLFGGSGTTMMAAEQLGRRSALMELDEHYCDVILTRWENYTGLKAEKAS